MATRVSGSERRRIAGLAADAGMSASAYLRDRALRQLAPFDEMAAMEQADAVIARMERDLDRANSELVAVLERLLPAICD
jgi:hypothetical protein